MRNCGWLGARPAFRGTLRRAAVAGLVAAGLTACTTGSGPPGARPATRPTTPGAAGATSAGTCPAAYAPLDPQRPSVRLHFTLAAEHDRVDGREHVEFTPDRPISEVVFRLVAEAPASHRRGAGLVVSSARVDGDQVQSTATEPTTLRLPLMAVHPASRRVSVDLTFQLRLPPAGVDRFGHTDRIAWWGSGYPLLAAVRGRSWVTERPGRTVAEFVASEAAAIETTVIAPSSDTVLMTGRAATPSPAGPGRRQWRSSADGARDVGVAVAPFALAEGTVAGVPVIVGVAPGVAVDPAQVLAATRAAVLGHAGRFGPYPFSALAVAALPGIGRSGVEYPGSVFIGDTRTRLVVDHEVAHQWFYGLVGNDQARDPWLDEAFATYAQALEDGIGVDTYRSALPVPGMVGAPVDSFGPGPEYATVVYAKGAAALLAARQRAGTGRFDEALRCYVRRLAWQVADDDDVRRALADVPAAVAELRAVGALSGGG